MLAQLIPQAGGEPITLKKDITLVGRKREICDLVIDRPSISKLHCMIVKTDGLLFIRDLGSTNGTKVNDQRVSRGAILPGDEIAFASIKFRILLGRKASEINEANAHTEMITNFSDDDSESDIRLISDDSVA